MRRVAISYNSDLRHVSQSYISPSEQVKLLMLTMLCSSPVCYRTRHHGLPLTPPQLRTQPQTSGIEEVTKLTVNSALYVIDYNCRSD